MSELRMKYECDCGCSGRAYHNQMVVVEAEQAIDRNLRKTGNVKRFWVLSKCREAFEEELAMSILLQKLVTAWAPRPMGRWWLVNAWLNPRYPWPRHLYNWIRRVNAARQVMRLQHEMNERIKGFEYARVKAINSAVLFGAPRFMQGFLARRFMKRLAQAEKKRLEESDNVVRMPDAHV